MTFPSTTVIDDTPKADAEKTMGGGGRGDANPAIAGWPTKIFLAVLCFLWLVPIFGTLVTSFRPLDDANTSGWWQVFTHPSYLGNLTLENYKNAINGANMGNDFINSLAIALPATFIPILIASFAAYAFTFMEFPGRDILFLTIVSMLVVPNYVAFVPLLKIYGTLGWNGTFPAGSRPARRGRGSRPRWRRRRSASSGRARPPG